MSRNEEIALTFLNALAKASGGCPATERLILQILPGDPGEAADNAWRPRAWRPGEDLPASPERTNGYVAISSFGRAPDGSWRRQKALFARGRMIMIDDVGTKVEKDRAAVLVPTWRVLTSPGNEQWIYLLKPGATQREKMDSILDGLVAQALAPQDAKDPGMKGVTRVARIPGFINGKAKYGGDFRVRWLKGPNGFGEEEEEGKHYSLEEIRAGFALKATEYRPIDRSAINLPREILAQRMDMFNVHIRIAKTLGLLDNGIRNAGGWQKARCPWEHEHTSSKDGADIREPSKENEFYGAFKCFHGHCDGRGWREFTDVLDALAAQDLAIGNERWAEFGRDL
jgi:hypothetical protein